MVKIFVFELKDFGNEDFLLALYRIGLNISRILFISKTGGGSSTVKFGNVVFGRQFLIGKIAIKNSNILMSGG